MSYSDYYTRSLEDPEGFWREQAKQIQWFNEPTQILTEEETGFFHWFPDGILNTAYLCLDYHVEQGRGEQPALIYDSPVTDRKETYTYQELRDATARFAGALKGLGVEKGDRVVIYMPMIPQTIIAMLACARIGAVHSVVFGGFAAHELAVRIDDAEPKLLLTASAGKEVDRVIDYLSIVNASLDEAKHSPSKCVVYQRPFHEAPLRPDRDLDWDEIVETATPADCVPLKATDPLYILYTSGTTGRPKGILRDQGGHAVAMKFSMSAIYDIQPGEVFWAASDVGWVVGHSYIVYGPLIHGCTTVLYEGKPVHTPDAGAFWRVVSEHQVRVMFTAPTAIRAIRREDPEGRFANEYDTSCLRYLFLAGERCDVSTLHWAEGLLRVPVIDHWWQTESGWPMAAKMAGIDKSPIKPGSAGKAVCGYGIEILDAEGVKLPANEEGAIAVRLPLPPGCLPNLWRNTERYKQAYLSTYPGSFYSGDGGYRDEDGYIFITGRLDDIIKVSGHRLSTASMEEAVAVHPAVAECAIISMPDKLKGEVPLGFVTLKANAEIAPARLQEEVVGLVRKHVGPIASLHRVLIVNQLPKTRSGKILRGIMRLMVRGEPFHPPSTIEDPAVLGDLAATIREHKLVTESPP